MVHAEAQIDQSAMCATTRHMKMQHRAAEDHSSVKVYYELKCVCDNHLRSSTRCARNASTELSGLLANVHGYIVCNYIYSD